MTIDDVMIQRRTKDLKGQENYKLTYIKHLIKEHLFACCKSISEFKIYLTNFKKKTTIVALDVSDTTVLTKNITKKNVIVFDKTAPSY